MHNYAYVTQETPLYFRRFGPVKWSPGHPWGGSGVLPLSAFCVRHEMRLCKKSIQRTVTSKQAEISRECWGTWMSRWKLVKGNQKLVKRVTTPIYPIYK